MPWMAIAAGLIPSIGVGLLFWMAMRAVVRADRNERAALAEHEADDPGMTERLPAAQEERPSEDPAK